MKIYTIIGGVNGSGKSSLTGALKAERTDLGQIIDVDKITAENGGDALAAFACSRSTNEDIYLLEKMARCAFETNNVDNCARV